MAANFGSAVFGRAFWGIDRNNDWSPQSYKILTRHKLGETNSRIRLEVYFYNLTIQPQIPACRYLKPLWGTSAPRAAMFFGTRYMECPLGLGLWLDGSRVRLHPGVNKYRWGMDKNGCICYMFVYTFTYIKSNWPSFMSFLAATMMGLTVTKPRLAPVDQHQLLPVRPPWSHRIWGDTAIEFKIET